MTFDDDPFAQPVGDPFATSRGLAPEDAGPPITYAVPPFEREFSGPQGDDRETGNSFGERQQASQPPLNTYAVLAPIFAVLTPPAGVALGHLALPQIKRTGQRGWLAAVCGLVLAYTMSVVLVAVLIWIALGGHSNRETSAGSSSAPATPSPSVVTSMAPAPMRPHNKLDLNQATVGKCVVIEKRDESGEVSADDALDLYQVPCQHRVGVYEVIARVSADSECNSVYVAAPPDHGFAVCLNRY